MTFSTTSYLAGIGSVVAVLSTGFAGGYLLARPGHIDPPNRLQRVAADDQTTRTAQPVATAVKPEVVAEAVSAAVTAPNETAVAPPTATMPTATPVEAKMPVEAKTPVINGQANSEKIAVDRISADRARAATDNKIAEKKRTETRKIAEQQRKQRELEVATVAVRRIIHERDDRDIQEVADDNDQTDAPERAMPRFSLFGQD